MTPRLVTAVAILSQRPSPWLHQRSFFLHPGAGEVSHFCSGSCYRLPDFQVQCLQSLITTVDGSTIKSPNAEAGVWSNVNTIREKATPTVVPYCHTSPTHPGPSFGMAGPRARVKARKKGNTPYICILPGVQSIGSLATTDGVVWPPASPPRLAGQ